MRKLIILTSAPEFLSGTDHFSHIILPQHAFEQENVTLPRKLHTTQWQKIPFSNAKGLLGTEHPFAFFDMRASNGVNFHLEAFAIVAGTIQEHGVLYVICPEWNNLSEQVDQDTLRWNENNAICTPSFYRFFKQCTAEFNFEVVEHLSSVTSGSFSKTFCQFTAQQQDIFENLPLHSADIHLITAPRGRGKSTLSGKLAERIANKHKIIITARNLSALPPIWQAIQSEKIQFIAPDKLLQRLEKKEIEFDNTWLFIDEAATLSLPMLAQFCQTFYKVVLTTTTQNYEGTGRGFSLKLLPLLQRQVKQWELTTPLRWQENDPLEQFVDKLLLLNDCDLVQLSTTKADFYRLLAEAHYKTTPTDLRRLFDAGNQILYPMIEQEKLVGGIWAMYEGGLDYALTQAIWRGERRPQGNLVAQYLCFQGNLPEACLLNSIRISRIAVSPTKQNQGLGKRLVSDFILQISQQKQPLVDFVSVSFGQTDALTHFWQQCGFELVQITPNKEASSGYHSAMMLYPLTEKGRRFLEKAQKRFLRNAYLLPYINNIEINHIDTELLLLTEDDWQDLSGFAYAQRSFQASYASLKRLYWKYPIYFSTMKDIFEQNLSLPHHKKIWLAQYRQQVKNILQENGVNACQI